MTIYEEIIKLRNASSNSLGRIQKFPELKPYGHVYTATLVAGGEAVSEVFKYNPDTFAGDDIDDILKWLLSKSNLVQGNLGYVECTEGGIGYLLESNADDHQRELYNGVKVSADGSTVRIPGTGIRYTVEPPGKKRNTNLDWKTLDASVLVVITAVAEWKDEAADICNKKLIDEWLMETAGDVTKALEYITSLDKLVTKALSHK